MQSMQLEEFNRDGVVVIPNAVSSSLVDKINDRIDLFHNNKSEFLNSNELLNEGMLQRVINFHSVIPELKYAFAECMDAASHIVDRFGEATLYTSLFFELGSQQSLHRDTPYFYTGSGELKYMGCWLALDDVDDTNGALMAAKGSHKLPEPDLVAIKEKFFPEGVETPSMHDGIFNEYNNQVNRLASQHGLEPTTIPVSKGDLIIWNPNTLHGGIPHQDKSKSRRSFVMHVTPPNTPIKHLDYFFHPDKFIEKVNISYETVRGRKLIPHNIVDFAHKFVTSSDELAF